MAWLRFIKCISSWKVFFALLIPSIVLDYWLFDGEATFFFWFCIIYIAFILPLSYSFYRRGGHQKLAALESDNSQEVKRIQSRDNVRYMLILVVIGLALIYGFLNGYTL